MAFAKLNSMKFVGLDGLSHFWSKAKAYTDTVCCNTINRDTLCLACSYACANTKTSCACAYTDTVCCNTINRDTLCLACSYACTNTKALCACTYAVSCTNTKAENGLACAYSCARSVCCNTINRDTLCLACSYSCANTKALCACTYANTVAGQCKGVACTYANCAINTYKGIGVVGVARSINGQCWNKGGYWSYMTLIDGPNCCWSYIIKMDWSGTGADKWSAGISIPNAFSPKHGIHYKYGCCGGHTGWTLVPDIYCVQTLSGSCASSIGAACKNAACAFAAACAAAVVPETSTFAKCYGKSTSCVECAHKVRLNAFSSNVYYKIPFTSTTGATATSGCLVVGTYPSYNPNSKVSCVYTECVAKTLAVPNGNGCFRLGSYCIYIG